ncbi:MAG TPA: SRPBCC domain-containing protein [Pseudomonadales bacterium]|nr:SRPBCC domain-containing protein [Pseudomonadales bacterium]
MTENEKDREIVLQRDIPFSRELIWKAITDPNHMKNWWGPDGFTIEKLSMDLRVGGCWTFDMVGPDGVRYPNHSVFKEITPHAKLIFDHGDGQSIWFESTITLEPSAKGTLITLRHLFVSRELREEVITKHGAIEGGIQHLAKLEAYVKNKLL